MHNNVTQQGILGYQNDPRPSGRPDVVALGDPVVEHPESVSGISTAGDITLLYEAMHITIYGFELENMTKVCSRLF